MAYRWLDSREIIAIHGEQVTTHGGSNGVRDRGLLESALARPQQQAHYENRSIFELAAAYAFGIIRNHPFIDGNKRAGLLAAYVFLSLNGWTLIAPEIDVYTAIMALAAGEMDEAGFAAWLAAGTTRRVDE